MYNSLPERTDDRVQSLANYYEDVELELENQHRGSWPRADLERMAQHAVAWMDTNLRDARVSPFNAMKPE